jgi:hypothetical protein
MSEEIEPSIRGAKVSREGPRSPFPSRAFAKVGLALAVLGWTPCAFAQTLIAVDDAFTVPYGQTLLVEVPGVLDNDTFGDGSAEDAGAGIDFVITDVSHGTLNLTSDGSFSYSPDATFLGTDTFTYQAIVGSQTSQATVTLTACGGGLAVFVCWKEAPFLEKLAGLGYASFQEGFENDAVWGAARTPLTAPSVVSQGIRWETNHPDPPASNEITTGSGPARTGLWAVFDPDHGYATGTPTECDVDTPPTHCLLKDGFTGNNVPGESPLYGVGGYFTGAAQPNLVVILDGGPPVSLGPLYVGGHQFFGVIDTGGLTSFRFEETDGKLGQARLVFADDFTFAHTGRISIFSDGFESGDTLAWSSTVP